MHKWHEIMIRIAEDNPDVTFRFNFPVDPLNPAHDGPMSISVFWPNNEQGEIYRTSGG